LFLAVAPLVFATCSYGLHPHTTLEGKPFKWDAIAAIQEGMGEGDVAGILGSPLEVLQDGPQAETWRYYERARLHGCREELLGFIVLADAPIRSLEARVHLRQGVVESVEVLRHE
jgi:hypothetical protein